MPIPIGLTDITFEHATAEMRQARQEAISRRDFRAATETQSSMVFHLAHGRTARLYVSQGPFQRFVQELLAAGGDAPDLHEEMRAVISEMAESPRPQSADMILTTFQRQASSALPGGESLKFEPTLRFKTLKNRGSTPIERKTFWERLLEDE